jgi:hypothetical protein
MPGFLDYSVATTLEPTDLFLIYRAGSGTLAITGQTITTYIQNIIEAALGVASYSVAMNYSQNPPPSTTFLTFIANQEFTLPTNFTGSQAEFVIGPTSALTLTINRNGSSIGTIIFPAESNSSAVGTFSGSGATFNVGDLLEIVAPSAVFGATNLALTFTGNLGA